MYIRMVTLLIIVIFKASDITGGVYIRVPEPASLLQFMLVRNYSASSLPP